MTELDAIKMAQAAARATAELEDENHRLREFLLKAADIVNSLWYGQLDGPYANFDWKHAIDRCEADIRDMFYGRCSMESEPPQAGDKSTEVSPSGEPTLKTAEQAACEKFALVMKEKYPSYYSHKCLPTEVDKK